MRVRLPSCAPGGAMDFFLNESRGRRRFKDLLGQANHLIVTSLVGLDGVERGLVTTPPLDLHAAWSPKDPIISARRARRLLLDMVLVRAVDSVDVYIRAVRQQPSLIQIPVLRNRIDGAGRSVLQKVMALEDHYGSADPVIFAMVLTMVAWRNKGVHEDADTRIEDRFGEILRSNASTIADQYRGLDVVRLLNGFQSSEPTFKEVASLISAAQEFVVTLERLLFRDLDKVQYLREPIWQVPEEASGDAAQRFRKRRMQSIWGRDPSDRTAAVLRLLREFGITDVRRYGEAAIFPALLVGDLSKFTPSKVYDWANPPR